MPKTTPKEELFNINKEAAKAGYTQSSVNGALKSHKSYANSIQQRHPADVRGIASKTFKLKTK